jgi:acetyl esterase/lipase
MRKFLLLIFALSCSACAFCQDTQWRTGIRDTSYSSEGELRKNIKYYPNIKLVQPEQLPDVLEKPKLVYLKRGQRKLHLDAFIPRKTIRNTAAVLIIHGGGWRSGDRSQHIPMAQHLASKGIASFTVEYRLSTEALYPNAVFDIKAAVRWVKVNAKKFNVDTNKIALLGFSAGGQLASLVGMTSKVGNLDENPNDKYSSSVNAVIDLDGVLYFIEAKSSPVPNNKVGASEMWMGYRQTVRQDLWNEAAPLTYASENRIPFLFINSSVERMHAGRDDFKKKMDEFGVYTEIVAFDDAPHSFCLFEPWFNPMINHIELFLGKVFK